MIPLKCQRMHVQGFTLVELIVVIVVLGILAVTAGPRLIGNQGAKEASLVAQAVSLLRLQQQRAMQDTVNPCYGVLIDTALSPNDCGSPVSNERQLGLPTNVTLTVQSSLAGADSGFLFNALGCPVSSNHSVSAEACGQSSVELQFAGVESRSICIQSQGFIRTGTC